MTAETIEHFFGVIESYSNLITPSFPFLGGYADNLAAQIGFPSDLVRYVATMFFMYPMALIFARLPSATMKHVFSIVVGVLGFQFALGSAWVNSLVTAVVTYLIVAFGPVKEAPYMVFIFNMTYMTAAHFYRIYFYYMGWSLDFTGPQMLLVIKLTSFAFNYYDGVHDRKRIESTVDNKGLMRVFKSRKENALERLPSLLEYFGYVYCFTTLLAGPAFELREYLDVVSGTRFLFKGKQQNPPRTWAGLSKLAAGLVCLVTHVVISEKYPMKMIYTESLLPSNFFARIVTLYICLIGVKTKYYFAWKVAEGSTVLSGFGFEGFQQDGSPVGWNKVSNVDIISFETSQSIRESSRSWNKGTQSWLERYVYSRTGNSLVATYFVSAFWHGFYPGYYFFFMSVPLPTAVNRLAYKRIRPYFLNKDGSSGALKKLYDIVGSFCTLTVLHYLVMPFQALSMEYSIQALSNLYFYGHITLVLAYIVFSLVPLRKFEAKKL